jgi:aminoglycoside phosphotransferase (APT) family kinase protein
VAEFMLGHVAGFSGDLTVERFAGGQSNPTYLLQSAGQRYVLRRKPFGPLLGGSAHAIEREFKILAALASRSDVPVPRPMAICTDSAVTGAAFYVMEYVPGRIFSDASLPELQRPQRAAHFNALIDTLARLHRVDPEAVGLGELQRPGNYFERQIHRWSRQYTQDLEVAGRVPAMEHLLEWLGAHAPDEPANALVHGDFRFDNVVFEPTRPTVSALLDWELATVGHPLADLGHFLMGYRMPALGVSGLLDKDLNALGIPSEQDMVRRYCAQTGRDAIPNLPYLLAFSFFRLSAICHGIRGRVTRGTASSAFAADYARHVEQLAALGWSEAQQANAAGSP